MNNADIEARQRAVASVAPQPRPIPGTIITERAAERLDPRPPAATDLAQIIQQNEQIIGLLSRLTQSIESVVSIGGDGFGRINT